MPRIRFATTFEPIISYLIPDRSPEGTQSVQSPSAERINFFKISLALSYAYLYIKTVLELYASLFAAPLALANAL